jgi:peptidoglycan/LPS O-acetylase OafA/YrhL
MHLKEGYLSVEPSSSLLGGLLVTIEQSVAAVLFAIALALAIVGAYYTRRRRFRFPVALAVLLFFLVVSFISQSFEGNAIWILFLWLSCVTGLALAFDVLTWRGKELNVKLVVSLWLLVTSLGGALANVYILSVPASLGARVFSLSFYILIHVPLLFALIAYFVGKKKYSDRVVRFIYTRGVKNGA